MIVESLVSYTKKLEFEVGSFTYIVNLRKSVLTGRFNMWLKPPC